MVKLTKAFKEKEKNETHYAGDLGIADGHMPLHTSDNHDGQNTNQKEFILFVGKSFTGVVCQGLQVNVHSGCLFRNVESYLGSIFDTHSLVEPLLKLIES
jgi:hypothetical protein